MCMHVVYDSIFVAPLFLFPIHTAFYVWNLVYVYYFGLVDHSGIKRTPIFPGEPDTIFHDDYHRYKQAYKPYGTHTHTLWIICPLPTFASNNILLRSETYLNECSPIPSIPNRDIHNLVSLRRVVCTPTHSTHYKLQVCNH